MKRTFWLLKIVLVYRGCWIIKCRIREGRLYQEYITPRTLGSTCKNVQYMYRTFSVAVSVAVMLLKKGSLERFCKTKIRTKFRDSPCKSVYEFLHELCVLHIFVVCAGQVHVRHDPISRNFLQQFISRSLQVSRPKLRSFALHDVERKFVRIFVLQNLSSDSFVSYEMSRCGLESFAVEEIYSYVYWRNNCIHWLYMYYKIG